MKKLRLVPVAGHEPVDPTGGAALPAPPRATTRPFSFDPIRRICCRIAGEILAPTAIGAMLNVNPRQVNRWSRYGLTEAQADALAVHLGRHPVQVWPDWYATTTVGELEAVAA
jgi:streptogramin lyase